MAYLGKYETRTADFKVYTSSTATATHTLSWTPTSKQSLRITINGVVQQDDAFELVGTTVTLDDPIVATDVLEIVGVNELGGQVLVPADGSIQTGKLGDNSVTLAKMAGLARGKIIVGDASGDPSALALGASTHVLTSDGTDAAWAAAATATNAPAFEYQLASTQTVADATWATIEFASQIYDTDGSGGTVYDTSTYTFTVPSGQAGKYFIYGGVVVYATAGGNQANVTQILFKDGDDNNAGTAEANTSGHGYMHTLNITSVFDMAVGDSLKLRGYMDTSGGGTVGFGSDGYPRSYFGGFKIIGI